MNRLTNIVGSTLGRETGVRFSRLSFDVLCRHLKQNPGIEQFAFGLFSLTKTAEGTVLIVNDLFIPEASDMTVQTSGLVTPSKEFQATVYLIARERGKGIIDFHTHTHPGVPRFSGTDQIHSEINAKYICENFPAPLTHAMIVFGNNVVGHDAVVFDRELGGFRTIDHIEVLGRGIRVNRTGTTNNADVNDDQYDRQRRVPGWNQELLARLRVSLIGGGGNGSHTLESLLAMGVGTEGWIALFDPDLVEESNLPRLPYAFQKHVGHSKVTVAAQFAGKKNTTVRFFPYPCSVTEPSALRRLRGSHVIIAAGDNDGVRKICNDEAIRYQIPLIDLGCDVQVNGRDVEAGGQVRIVLPGTNACLICCSGFDPSQAAIDLMDDSQAAVHAARGYFRGADAPPSPSIANLNAMTAQLGVNALLSLVHGPDFGNWDYVHFNQFTAGTVTAQSKHRSDCPLCGDEGVLADGDEVEEATSSNDLMVPPVGTAMTIV